MGLSMSQPSGLRRIIRWAAIVLLGFIFALATASFIPLLISTSSDVLQDVFTLWRSKPWWSRIPIILYAGEFCVTLINSLYFLLVSLCQEFSWTQVMWFCFGIIQLSISFLIGFSILLILLKLPLVGLFLVLSYLLQLGICMFFLLFVFFRK